MVNNIYLSFFFLCHAFLKNWTTVSHCQQLKLNVSNLSAVPPSPSSIMLCFFFEEFIQRPRIVLVNLRNNVVSHSVCFLTRVYHFSFIQALWILALEHFFLHACRVKTLGFRKIERIMSLWIVVWAYVLIYIFYLIQKFQRFGLSLTES